jgi:hypothetical protein
MSLGELDITISWRPPALFFSYCASMIVLSRPRQESAG